MMTYNDVVLGFIQREFSPLKHAAKLLARAAGTTPRCAKAWLAGDRAARWRGYGGRHRSGTNKVSVDFYVWVAQSGGSGTVVRVPDPPPADRGGRVSGAAAP